MCGYNVLQKNVFYIQFNYLEKATLCRTKVSFRHPHSRLFIAILWKCSCSKNTYVNFVSPVKFRFSCEISVYPLSHAYFPIKLSPWYGLYFWWDNLNSLASSIFIKENNWMKSNYFELNSTAGKFEECFTLTVLIFTM